MNEIKDLVSIIVPVYNGENYIHNILDSLVNQTYKNYEVFIVDDGSTDNTVQKILEYKTKIKNLTVIRSTHRNASAAINKALPLIQGEYLIWPDADDILEPDSIKIRVEFLQKNKEYNIIRSTQYYFDDNGLTAHRDEHLGDIAKENIFLDVLFNRTFICCGCYMIRTKPFFGIYRYKQIPEFDYGQNFQMLLPMLYFNKCKTINEPLYGVYVRQNSNSRQELTKTQEFKKYLGFEHLIDKLVHIMLIVDEYTLQQIKIWKIQRRYDLYKKYLYKKKAYQSLKKLKEYKHINIIEYTKRKLRIRIRGTFTEKVLYALIKKEALSEIIQ